MLYQKFLIIYIYIIYEPVLACVLSLACLCSHQLVCCSGVGKDGALRVVNSGIGINEAASIDLVGIKGIE